MKSKVIILILLFTTVLGYSQNDKVVVSEKKNRKRVVLMAENKTADTLNVFIMLTAQGYRRSADRPAVLNIPPYKKVHVTTLIEMENQESSYTYDVIINEKQDNTETEPTESDIVDIENVIKGKVVLFSKSDCPKCETLSAFLFEAQQPHRVFNIDENPKLYRQFMNIIAEELQQTTKIRFPVIWNKTYTIFGYEDLEKVVEEIRKRN